MQEGLARCETAEDVRSVFRADVEWITVNGRHIPIGEDGTPTTSAGKAILAGSKSSGSEKGKDKPSATGKEDTPNDSVKSIRAKAAHVMVGSDIQRYSEEHNENAAAKALGGVSLRDNEPVDILVIEQGVVKHGVELKTMVANTNGKITMKTSAMQKKSEWMKKNAAPFHTVVFDDHKVFNAQGEGKHGPDSDRQIYYKRGFGSFRISSMHKVKDMAELKTLMNTASADLPSAAKPPKSYVEPKESE